MEPVTKESDCPNGSENTSLLVLIPKALCERAGACGLKRLDRISPKRFNRAKASRFESWNISSAPVPDKAATIQC
jgi:hypothetical protein